MKDEFLYTKLVKECVFGLCKKCIDKPNNSSKKNNRCLWSELHILYDENTPYFHIVALYCNRILSDKIIFIIINEYC